MRNRIKATFAGAAAGLLLAAGPLRAQEQLAEQDVRGFFDTMRQTITDAVEAGSFDELLQWTQDHIADGATFAASNEIYIGEDRKGFGTFTLDKEDMMRFGRMALGMMSGMGERPIEDYSLQIEVSEVTPVGPDAATVTVDYTETATFSVPAEQTAGATDAAGATDETQTSSTGADDAEAAGDQAAQAAGQTVEITATATCTHLVKRGETGEDFALGLSTCEARTEF